MTYTVNVEVNKDHAHRTQKHSFIENAHNETSQDSTIIVIHVPYSHF